MSQTLPHSSNVDRYLHFIKVLSRGPRTAYEVQVETGLCEKTVLKLIRLTAKSGAIAPAGVVDRQEAPGDHGLLPMRWEWVGFK